MTQDIFNDPTYPHAYVCSADDINAGVSGLPAAGHWRILYIPYFASNEGWSVQVAVGAVANSGLCWRKASGTVWGSWESAATATPPQEFELPLADNVTALYGCKYSKDAFGRVLVYGAVAPQQALESSSALATLPAGFRPSSEQRFPGICATASTLAESRAIGVHPSGQITVRGGDVPSATQYIAFFAMFPAV